MRSRLSWAFTRVVAGLRLSHVEAGALRQDLRYTLRSLRATPGFTIIAVLSLGFGIGSATTLFSAVDAVDLRPLPFSDPNRLVWLAEVTPQEYELCARCPSQTSPSTAAEWFRQSRSFDAAGAIASTSLDWFRDEVTESTPAVRATPGLLPLLGGSPIIGRDFAADDTLEGAEAVALLSYEFWQRRFGADSAVLGRHLATGDAPAAASRLTIIGVLPKDFRFVESPAVWLPLRMGSRASRRDRNIVAIARLKPGIDVSEASAELGTIAGRLRADAPEDYAGWDARAEPLRSYLKIFASKGRFILFAITVLVLLTGVLNMTGLLLARATARRYEFALRIALGADRTRLVRQLLVEGATIGLAGGIAGILFSAWGAQFVSAWLRIEATGLDTAIDARVLLFALALSLVVGIGASLVPALRAGRSDLAPGLRVHGGRPKHGAHSNVLIVSQVGVAVILLSAATILSNEYLKVRYLDLGYEPRDLYTTAVRATPSQQSDGFVAWKPIVEAARMQLTLLSGVQSASLEHLSATHPQIVRPILLEASTRTTPPVKGVDPDYFRTWGMHLVEGRLFTIEDRLGAQPVAIVTDDAAAMFWPRQSAVGKRVFVGDSGSVGEILTVVGIVRGAERGQLAERGWPVLFRPFAQTKLYAPGITFSLRVTSAAPSTLASAASVLRDITGGRVRAFRSELDLVRRRFVSHRLNAIALNFFSVFGLLLIGMGLYANVAYSVSLRLNEVALRMAFGAHPRSVLRLLVQNSFIVVMKGIALGIVGAVIVAKVLPTSAAGTSAADHVLEYCIAVLAMFLVAMLATYIPARRAVVIDPVVLLRAD